MPSGSHGGGGGSHGGGGSFGGGGSHFGRSSSGSYSSRPIRPFRFGWGSRIYVVSGTKGSILRIFIGVSIFLIIIASFVLFGINSSKQKLATIEADYNYYQNMIEYSETHTEYQIQGEITDVYYNERAEKYYYTYSFTGTNSVTVSNGFTYSIYDSTENIRRGTIIVLALNNPKSQVTSSTDSIPLDYKDTVVTDDGEYVYYKDSITTSRIASITMYLLAGGLIVATVVLFNKSKTLANNSNTTTSTDTTKKYCSYCGSIIPDSKTQCPSCGSTITNKNTK